MRQIRECSVAVVGGAGFLGSHCVDHLINDRNCDVLVIDNLCAGRREFIHPKAKFIHADITHSESFLLNVFNKHKVQYVFSYAAYPYVPDSFDRPLHVCEVNFNGAIKVINAAQEAGCVGVLQISSAEIYGSAGEPKYDHNGERFSHGETWRCMEETEVIPHSSYGVSKAAVDAYVQVRWQEARTPCIALRQFNCLGERDEAHPYVAPEIMRQLVKQSRNTVACVKLGNNSVRDFMYSGDQAKIATLLLEYGDFGNVYNLGSETGIKIYDLAKLIGKLMGFKEVVVEVDESRKRPWEIWHLQSDNTKIRCAIPVFPMLTSLEESLNRMVQYFEKNDWRMSW